MAKTTATVDRLNAGLAWLDREIEETMHMITAMQRALNGLKAERNFLIKTPKQDQRPV